MAKKRYEVRLLVEVTVEAGTAQAAEDLVWLALRDAVHPLARPADAWAIRGTGARPAAEQDRCAGELMGYGLSPEDAIS